MLHRVIFANEQMVTNLSRQHFPFTPSKLNQKFGGWYIFIDRATSIISKSSKCRGSGHLKPNYYFVVLIVTAEV